MVVVAYSVVSFVLEKKEQMVAQLLCWCCVFCRSSIPLLVSPPLCFLSYPAYSLCLSLIYTLFSMFFVSAVSFSPPSPLRCSTSSGFYSQRMQAFSLCCCRDGVTAGGHHGSRETCPLIEANRALAAANVSRPPARNVF